VEYFSGEPLGKRSLGRFKKIRKDKIDMDLKKLGCEYGRKMGMVNDLVITGFLD
jgi:hypothetical protein